MLQGQLLCAVALAAGAYDMGPTYGKDYAGQDYNVTMWHSPPSASANHYQSAALACEQYCLADPTCCAWTYVPPGSPSDPERCCLKNSVPAELDAVHWTGLSPRAVTGKDNATLTPQCGTVHPVPPPPIPYPGPTYLHPTIHNSPSCLHLGGWHDIAGALSYLGTHHVFQGCPASGGWHHSASTDLVHWEDRGLGPSRVLETHAGMDSHDTPCSGFVTVDDNGVPCAGFRQCGSDKGVVGGKPWDVPLEIRCANDSNLTQWSDPIYLYDVFFYRALPYDPIRPWKDTDGKWYSGISVDACNATGARCNLGAELDLWVSPALRGPQAQWTRLPTPMLSTNKTYPCNTQGQCGLKLNEFVTSNYFGSVPGDPLGGKSRVFTANQGPDTGAGTAFYIGTQSNGSPLDVDWKNPNATGIIDFGTYTMARTLGSDPNQVTVPGRRVIVGWIGGPATASQSLARDLSFSPDRELLQAFVPELQSLRVAGSHTVGTGSTPPVLAGQQAEVLATFTFTPRGSLPAGDGWTPLLAKGGFGEVDVGSAGFASALASSPSGIIRRDCIDCDPLYRAVYYRRLTPVPPSLDLRYTLMSNWSNNPGNGFNKDFALYSTLADALGDNTSARWQFCNFDDVGVGAFRDCGPQGPLPSNWNSWSGRGGEASVRFVVASSAHPSPDPVLPGPTDGFGVHVHGVGGNGTEHAFLSVNPLTGQVSVGAVNQSGDCGGSTCTYTAPLLPIDAAAVTVHAILDHELIEVIFNNRTAFTFRTQPSSADAGYVSIGGTGFTSASVQTWKLKSANNY